MENNELRKYLKNVATMEDFVVLLNLIKYDEFKTNEFSYTEQQLWYLSNCNNPNRYKKFSIPKKNGGSREINAPRYQLKRILYLLNIIFQALYTPGEAAMGFTKGRSIVTNARKHIGQNYVFNIDLENFFSSIPLSKIWRRLQTPPFNFPKNIATVISGLCCIKNEQNKTYVLPQGAATSPILTNAVCDNLDKKLSKLARKYGLHFTRYADDMTFSSMHNVYQSDSKFLCELRDIIEDEGFKLNKQKTRLSKRNQRQEVTGLIVNEKENICRFYIKEVRCIIHNWEKDGYKIAYSKFYNCYKSKKGYIKKGEPMMENVIEGKLNYIKMVKGGKNQAHLKLNNRFCKLKNQLYEERKNNQSKNLNIMYQFSLKEFSLLFKTNILFTITESEFKAECYINGIKTHIAICDFIHSYWKTNKISHMDFISKYISESNICLCLKKGKRFWLINHC